MRAAQERRAVQHFFHKWTKMCFLRCVTACVRQALTLSLFWELLPPIPGDCILWVSSPQGCLGMFVLAAPLASQPRAKTWARVLSPCEKQSWLAAAVHLMHGMLHQERGICPAAVPGIFWGSIRWESAGAWGLLYLTKWLRNHFRVELWDSLLHLGAHLEAVRDWFVEYLYFLLVEILMVWNRNSQISGYEETVAWAGHKQQVSNRAGAKFPFPDFHSCSSTTRCDFYCHS